VCFTFSSFFPFQLRSFCSWVVWFSCVSFSFCSIRKNISEIMYLVSSGTLNLDSQHSKRGDVLPLRSQLKNEERISPVSHSPGWSQKRYLAVQMFCAGSSVKEGQLKKCSGIVVFAC